MPPQYDESREPDENDDGEHDARDGHKKLKDSLVEFPSFLRLQFWPDEDPTLEERLEKRIKSVETFDQMSSQSFIAYRYKCPWEEYQGENGDEVHRRRLLLRLVCESLHLSR